MLLAHLGILVEEHELISLLQSFPQGIYLGDLNRLPGLFPDVQAQVVHPADSSILLAWLRRGVPVMIYLDTSRVSYWDRPAFHGVVVIHADPSGFLIHDPMYPTILEPGLPRAVARAELLAAWEAVGSPLVILTRG